MLTHLLEMLEPSYDLMDAIDLLGLIVGIFVLLLFGLVSHLRYR